MAQPHSAPPIPWLKLAFGTDQDAAMRNGVIVVAIVGLLAIAAGLLLKQASERLTEKTRDLQRWEDDGGNPQAHVPSTEPQSA